ncbi:calmodulin-alpha-like [Branchiostoma floridae]|uniref:Calmodulin-alpha-like n=1 Tax=Branchiostoma floridae TaxID=7739 RepID=A0A9J7KQ02_BRAFL|nr:calmodulin-alpha-like [Branchiostoma floridae]XP_035668054.1 calmodulin-alpha-like [Branchiostoma floridae]
MAQQNGETSLTREELTELQMAFQEFDKDGNGMIDRRELLNVMRCLGLNPSSMEVVEMLASVDEDGSGTIDFEEFVILMTTKLPGATDVSDPIETLYSSEILREAFRVFDKDGLGYVHESELRYNLTHLGHKLSDSDVDELLRHIDIDSDGQFSYQDVVTKLCIQRNFNKNIDAKRKKSRSKTSLNQTSLSKSKETLV